MYFSIFFALLTLCEADLWYWSSEEAEIAEIVDVLSTNIATYIKIPLPNLAIVPD